MKTKKIPMRSCVVTRERLEKKQLIRIVRTPDAKIEIDLSGKMNGRGAYIKRDPSVIEKARKSKVLERHLENPIPDTIYEELLQIVEAEQA